MVISQGTTKAERIRLYMVIGMITKITSFKKPKYGDGDFDHWGSNGKSDCAPDD